MVGEAGPGTPSCSGPAPSREGAWLRSRPGRRRRRWRRCVRCGAGRGHRVAALRPDHGARSAAPASAAAPRTGECGLRPPGLPGPGPFPARLRAALLPWGRAGAGRAPAAPWRSEVAASRLVRTGGRRGPLRAAAPPRVLPYSPAASFLLAAQPTAASRRRGPAAVLTRAVSWPSGRGAAGCTLSRCGASARHPGCRWRRGLCTRPTHDARGCPASSTFTSLALRAPLPHFSSPACPPPWGPALSILGFALPAPLRPRAPRAWCPLLPGCGPARLPASADRLGSPSAGKGVGHWRGTRRRTGDKAARLGAALPGWIVPGRLSCARPRGPRRLALAPPPRQSFSEWKTFSFPSVILTDNGDFFLI